MRREGAPAPTLALMSLASGLEPARPRGRIHPTPAPLRWIRHTSLAVLPLEPARPRAAFLELARGPLLPDPALGSLIASLNRFLSGGNAVALEELID